MSAASAARAIVAHAARSSASSVAGSIPAITVTAAMSGNWTHEPSSTGFPLPPAAPSPPLADWRLSPPAAIGSEVEDARPTIGRQTGRRHIVLIRRVGLSIGCAVAFVAAAAGSPAMAAEDYAPTSEQASDIATVLHEAEDCLQTGISTVDRRWAVAEFVGLAGRDGCRAVALPRVLLRERTDGIWEVKARVSFLRRCPIKAVPTRVARKLGACVEAKPKDRFCGSLHLKAGPAEMHAIGTSCKVARVVLKRRARHRRLPAGWACSGGGVNPAVRATCRNGSRRAVLYQPESVYGE
jgi:hypothetical protein